MGSYQRHIPNSAETDPFNERLRATLDGTVDQLSVEDQLTPEQIKAAERLSFQADSIKAANRENADAFLADHPEFLDTPRNADRMNRMLDSLFGHDRAYSRDMFESAFNALRVMPRSLEIDDAVVVQRQQEEANAKRLAARQAKDRDTLPSEDQLYNLPLEEVRRLETLEIQRQMQRRGEEGGW